MSSRRNSVSSVSVSERSVSEPSQATTEPYREDPRIVQAVQKPSPRKSGPSALCITTGLAIIAVVLFGVGGFIGGYLLRQTQEEDRLKNDPHHRNVNVSWSESPCSQNICHGFRASFLSPETTPILWKLKECGTSADSLRPVYPATSFPNQYTVATGLYPESHGIVDDVFRDGDSGNLFNSQDSSTNSLPEWWKGEAIWITAKKQGKRVNIHSWAGSEVPQQGTRPDVVLSSNSASSLRSQIEKAVEWLSVDNADLVMLQREAPRLAGLRYKITSVEFKHAMADIDGAIHFLMQTLQEKKLLSCVNIVILSDHGSEESSCKTTDVLSILRNNIRNVSIDDANLQYFGGTHGRLGIKNPGISRQMIHQALTCTTQTDATKGSIGYQLFSKGDFPRRLHYANSQRIEEFLFSVVPGQTLGSSRTSVGICEGNLHGYDNIHTSMAGIFLAYGPSIKSSHHVGSFGNVEIYNLLCELLDVQPAQNNGTKGMLNDVLRTLKKQDLRQDTAVVEPGIVTFPTRDEMLRRQTGSCGSGCSSEPILDLDLRLNISKTLSASLRYVHSEPFGIPKGSPTSQLILLVNREFLLGYDMRLQLPLWTSFAISRDATQDFTAAFAASVDCDRNDVRLARGATLSCADFWYGPNAGYLEAWQRIVPSYLVPPGIYGDMSDGTDGKTITNIAPMYRLFRDDVWLPFWQMVLQWSRINDRLHTFVGLIFDHSPPFGWPDALSNISFVPGLPKVSLPSHFFIIITRKSTDVACDKDCKADVIAFILPHKPEGRRESCMDSEAYFLLNSASVRDIETLTNLRFFSGLPAYDGIRLRTFQPVKLWHMATGL